MNIIFGTLELTTISGVGMYLVTVAEQLERMGHPVTIATEEVGDMAAIAEGRGLRIVTDGGELPNACDVVYVQDAPSAYRLAERYPDVPRSFCVHATDYDRWLVPQIPGLTNAAVTFSEQATRYVKSLAHVPQVVQLTQPVDTRRFSPRGAVEKQPRRALWLGNYAFGNRLDLLLEACMDAGVELVLRGLSTGVFTTAPETDMNNCDIVVGRSRVIVEAMACGRAAYVYDVTGADGWVTHDRYPQLVADNFDGQVEGRPIDAGALRDDLLAYRPEMGPDNRDLAVTHHNARSHCVSLVEMFGRTEAQSVPTAPLEELSRLARVQWQADSRSLGFEHEAKLLREELRRRNSEQSELHELVAGVERRATEAERRATEAERQATEAQLALERLEAEHGVAGAARKVAILPARSIRRLRRRVRRN